MQTLSRVGIVGGGAIGSAIGQALTEVGIDIAYWDIDPAKATVGSLAELIRGTPVIFLAIPSWADRPVITEIAGCIDGTNRPLVISVSKGVEPGFITIDKIFEECSQGKFDYGLLYGPMLAKEITAGKHGYGVLATNTDRWHGVLDIKGARLVATYSIDMRGVALAGPLKNIYSLALGLCDGLDLGFDTKGMLTLQAATEMKRIISEQGGSPEAVDGPAGIADLVATGWSGLSFNYRVSRELGAGTITHENAKSEGINALREIPAIYDVKTLPLLNSLYGIFVEKQSPAELKSVLSL